MIKENQRQVTKLLLVPTATKHTVYIRVMRSSQIFLKILLLAGDARLLLSKTENKSYRATMLLEDNVADFLTG